MIFKIVAAVFALILFAEYFGLWYKHKELVEKIGNLSLEVVKLNQKIDAVDRSTGADVHQVREELSAFKTEFGDAAIEEMRQNAREQKAWADGLNGIMSYGARFQGRGEDM